MKAVIFIPDCCSRAKLLAETLKLPMSVKMKLDEYMCGRMSADDAVREIVKMCRKADGRRALFGWTLVVHDCSWEEVEEVVAEVGGDIVYA
jgi:hypothetical protein